MSDFHAPAASPDEAVEALIQRCLGGDQVAWEEIVRLYRRRVFNTAYKFVGRHDQAEKSKAGNLPALKDEFKRAAADKERLEKAIEAKQKEKDDTRKRYAEYRKRYTELKSGQVLSGQVSTPAPTTASTSVPAPVSKPVTAAVPAKK